jgi:hypothetical protein
MNRTTRLRLVIQNSPHEYPIAIIIRSLNNTIVRRNTCSQFILLAISEEKSLGEFKKSIYCIEIIKEFIIKWFMFVKTSEHLFTNNIFVSKLILVYLNVFSNFFLEKIFKNCKWLLTKNAKKLIPICFSFLIKRNFSASTQFFYMI